MEPYQSTQNDMQTDSEIDPDNSESCDSSPETSRYMASGTISSQPLSSPEDFHCMSVTVTSDQAALIEAETRFQSNCAQWCEERRIRVTATLCKEIVCSRKAHMDCLVRRKFRRTFLGTSATRYGQETQTLSEYVYFCQQTDAQLCVQPSGHITWCTVFGMFSRWHRPFSQLT